MSFIDYLRESEDDSDIEDVTPEEILAVIKDELSLLDEDEIDALGSVLFNQFFSELEDVTPEDGLDYFDEDDILAMLDEIGEDAYDVVLDMLSDDDFEEDDLAEAVSRIMKRGNMNKKKRKFMVLSKNDLKKTAVTRKRDQRKKLSKTRRYYKANKIKIKSYQKSRDVAIKKGKHLVKKRRVAG